MSEVAQGKKRLTITISEDALEWIDDNIAISKFSSRSHALEFAIASLQKRNSDLEDAKGDAMELWREVQELGSRLLFLSRERKALEARIEALEAERAEAADSV